MLPSCRSRSLSPAAACTFSLLLLLVCLPLAGQTTAQTVSGTVLDGASNQAVFRALVRLTGGSGQRAVLTDSSGHFSFADVDAQQFSLTAVKPGYTFTRAFNDPNQLRLKLEDAANPVQLVLYPKAILTGTISDPEGKPLPDITLQPLRGIDDEGGHHWIPVGFTHSDSHGQFRLQVAAGDYRLQTDISRADGASAILPVSLPAPGDPPVHLNPGDQRDLDLRPKVAPLIAVSARLNLPVDQISRLTAIYADGTSFPVSMTPTGATTLDMKLPAGSYLLQSRRRSSGSDGLDEAALTVVPSTKQPIALSLQFVHIGSIPIELAFDDATLEAAAGAGQTLNLPSVRSLGLTLEPTSPQPASVSEYLRANSSRDDPSTTFTAPPGTYRMRAARNYSWFVTSASYGGTDLLAHDLTIAAGTGSTPILITVSNQTATLAGNVTLNGAPAACWIYLIAITPSATPVLTLRSSQNGVFSQTIPPGTYRAIASASRRSPNLETLAQLNGSTLTATAGGRTTITLEVSSNSEPHP